MRQATQEKEQFEAQKLLVEERIDALERVLGNLNAAMAAYQQGVLPSESSSLDEITGECYRRW